MPHHEFLQLDERTSIEACVAQNGAYRLALWRDGRCMVEFRSEKDHHWKRSLERTSAYEFRSIEQLRYDFEQDVAAAAA